LTQHYLACLSHASYLIGDETSGRAVVADPRRDVGVYQEEAAERGLRTERVIETHLHADFLSGHLELAHRTGAVICYGAGAAGQQPGQQVPPSGRCAGIAPGPAHARRVSYPAEAPCRIFTAGARTPHPGCPTSGGKIRAQLNRGPSSVPERVRIVSQFSPLDDRPPERP
jgi:glyoxylase-like metal-dependent hydrolase (beta-lactamase superfamily II)